MVVSIEYAILGLLSWKSLTGYDIKKIINNSSYMYWSGNNNQIYRTLVKLGKNKLVEVETVHEDGLPTKKLYKTTEKGDSELKNWVLNPTEAPILKNTFLIKLAWSDILSKSEINKLVENYENEISSQLILNKEIKRRALYSPKRTKREEVLWDMISENTIYYYENELKWIRKLKHKLDLE
jgi:DNA-binding PadR family transcriptional regulator